VTRDRCRFLGATAACFRASQKARFTLGGMSVPGKECSQSELMQPHIYGPGHRSASPHVGLSREPTLALEPTLPGVVGADQIENLARNQEP
jgi:hypothetical protein